MNKLEKSYILILIILIFISLYLSGFKFFHNKYHEAIKALIIIPIIFLPAIIRKLFKKKPNYLLDITIIIFVFIAWYLGGSMKYYVTVSNYDKVIHFLFGIFGCLIAIFIMKKFKTLNKNIFFNIIFFISFSMLFGVIWEILEYFDDKLFIANNQRLDTGVNDTMLDLIFTLIGSMFFSIIYIIENKCNKNLLIKNYIKNI